MRLHRRGPSSPGWRCEQRLRSFMVERTGVPVRDVAEAVAPILDRSLRVVVNAARD